MKDRQNTAGYGVVAGTTVALIVPALATLFTVRHPRPAVPVELADTPYGYTISLSMFAVPIAAMALTFFKNPVFIAQRRAFWTAMVLLVAQGFLLDLVFGMTFYTFGNRGATIGLWVPVRGGAVPVEEFFFYGLGFVAILMAYLWFNDAWLARYRVPVPEGAAARDMKLLGFHGASLVLAVALFAAGLAFKKLGPTPQGFPGYFTVLLLVAIVPSVAFFEAVRPYINWRSFTVVGALLVAVSLLWEATLAGPYHWWNYVDAEMLGIYIAAWSNLPIEAVLLWFAVTYATVIYYEVIRLWFARKDAAAG